MNLFFRIILWGLLTLMLKDAQSQPAVESHSLEVKKKRTARKVSVSEFKNSKMQFEEE